MLFINDDQSQIGKWRKQSRAWADHYVNLSCLHPFHLVKPLSLGHPGIQDGHPVAKLPIEPHDRLIRKGDLRDQDDGLPAFLQHSVNHLHIDFCLAASGNPIYKIVFPLSLSIVIPEYADGMPLLIRKPDFFPFPHFVLYRIAKYLFRLKRHDLLFLQRSYHCPGDVQLPGQKFVLLLRLIQ